jgi:hypothetical protein
VRAKRVAEFGQSYSPGVTVKQFNAQLSFKMLDVLTERRLRGSQYLRSAGQTAAIRDVYK